ncbi:MAG: DUF6951 family protein [Anaerolineae bacterium]
MAEAIIKAGICGFTTRVHAHMNNDGGAVRLSIESDCPSVQCLATRLTQVDPWREISYRGEEPVVLDEARACLPHPACVVPGGILKCIEAAAGLALPADAAIHFQLEDGGA